MQDTFYSCLDFCKMHDRLPYFYITGLETLSPAEPGLYLWQGDITTLRCDAIVNAADSVIIGAGAGLSTGIRNPVS